MTLPVIRRAALGAVVATLAAGALAPVLEAQASPTGGAPLRYYRGVIGLNPLGIPFDIFAVEAEGAVAPGVTAAAALSYFAPDEDRFTSADVKVRYYPGEIALDGFSVGLGAGLTGRGGPDVSAPCVVNPADNSCDQPRTSVTGPTISVLADYNFLLGERRRFLVGTGVGAKRWLVDREARERLGAERAWVFARFLVGLAF